MRPQADYQSSGCASKKRTISFPLTYLRLPQERSFSPRRRAARRADSVHRNLFLASSRV